MNSKPWPPAVKNRKVPLERRLNNLWNALQYESYEMSFESALEDVKLQLDKLEEEHGPNAREYYVKHYKITEKFGVK